MTNQKSDKDISQVRELIFGDQMRQNENKFASLDERLDEIKKEIAKAAQENNQRFKQVEKDAQKMQDKLENHIEKVKKDLTEALDSAKSQILKKIDQLIQDKTDRMELGNLLIESGMRIKGENIMEALKAKAKTE